MEMEKKLKILFTGNSLGGGGAERVLAIISSELAQKGHQITIICGTSDKEYPVNKAVRKIYFGDYVSYKSYNSHIAQIYGWLKNVIQIFKLYSKKIDEIRPDVVVSFTRVGWISLIPLCLFKKKPLIFSEHTTFNLTKEKKSFKNSIRRFFLRFSDAVTILTKYDEDYLGNKLPQKVVIPNPLTFSPITENEYEQSFPLRKNILACGRVLNWKIKGFDNLIKAYGAIADKYPGWDLDIAGWGRQEDFDYLYSIADKYNVRSRIHFLGFCSNVQELMKEHSIFVLSSRIEGFPMVLTEAMCMGCVPVCFDVITGPREIITEGIDGLLVENQNIEALSKAIEIAINDESLRFNYGRNAIDNIKRLEPSVICKKWEDMFQNVINKRMSNHN